MRNEWKEVNGMMVKEVGARTDCESQEAKTDN